MNSYIDYNYYCETFKGNLIPEDQFENLAIKASSKVRNRIFNRSISGFENEVKHATCLVADILYNQIQNKEKFKNILIGKDAQVSSEKVGDYSVTMTNLSLSDLEKYSSDEYINKQIAQELENCLFLTGLLYTGVPYVD